MTGPYVKKAHSVSIGKLYKEVATQKVLFVRNNRPAEPVDVSDSSLLELFPTDRAVALEVYIRTPRLSVDPTKYRMAFPCCSGIGAHKHHCPEKLCKSCAGLRTHRPNCPNRRPDPITAEEIVEANK